MDRIIVYPGGIPLDTDLLSTNRNAMVAIGYLAQAVLGSGVVVDGLACVPTAPASLTITVGSGSIGQLSVVDALAYGSLPADSTDPLVKLGINTSPTSFALAAPTTSGQSINYLIQAALQESDTSPVVLPYYNAANPSQPYSGPNNAGTAQNTQRIERVQLQLKAGAPAAAGSQTTPPVDNGWVGLYVVTVNYGQTQVAAASITTLPTAPFLAFKLPSLRPGYTSLQSFTSSGSFVVPPGVSRVRATVIGGGGSGGWHTSLPGGGGGAGGRAIKIVSGLVSGQSVAVTVGAGGAAPGSQANGGTGGSSSFGSFVSATGGAGGNGGSAAIFSLAGGQGGQGFGGDVNDAGAWGTDGVSVGLRGGDGGGPGGARGVTGPINGLSASGFGGGGGAGGSSATTGGSGFPAGNGGGGLVIVEY